MLQIPLRVMVFIDGSNLLHSSQRFKQGFKIDYVKLVQELVGGRNMIRSYFYCSYKIPPNEKETKFHEALKRQGIAVVARRLRQRGSQYVEKGVDVALVTDMLGFAFKNAYDVAILVSGDEDYVGAVDEIKRVGKKVEIASFEFAAARELKLIADRFISLETLIDKIELKRTKK